MQTHRVSLPSVQQKPDTRQPQQHRNYRVEMIFRGKIKVVDFRLERFENLAVSRHICGQNEHDNPLGSRDGLIS